MGCRSFVCSERARAGRRADNKPGTAALLVDTSVTINGTDIPLQLYAGETSHEVAKEFAAANKLDRAGRQTIAQHLDRNSATTTYPHVGPSSASAAAAPSTAPSSCAPAPSSASQEKHMAPHIGSGCESECADCLSVLCAAADSARPLPSGRQIGPACTHRSVGHPSGGGPSGGGPLHSARCRSRPVRPAV